MKSSFKTIIIISLVFIVNTCLAQTKFVPQLIRHLYWVDTSGIGIDSIGYWKETYNSYNKYSNNNIIENGSVNFISKDTTNKITSVYDNYNRKIEEIYYSNFNSTNHKLIKNSRSSYFYPDNNGSIETNTFTYDTTTDIWIPTYRSKYMLDKNKNPVFVFDETIQNGVWYTNNNKKSSYHYLPNTDLITLRIDSAFNSFTQKFDAYNSNECLYDKKNNIIQITRYQKINSEWIPVYKNLFKYTNGKNDQLLIVEFYNSDSIIYKYDHLKWKNPVPIYYPIHKDAMESYFSDFSEYIETFSSWKKSKEVKTIFTDLNGSNELYTKILFNQDSSEFKAVSSYNDFKRLTLSEFFTYNTNSGWNRLNGYKYDLKYNSYNTLYELTNMPLVQNNYFLSSKEIYEDFITVQIPNISIPAEINLYPNPTSGLIKLDLPENTQAKINVINNLGALQRTYYSQTNQIDLQDLPNGIYFLKIEALDKTYNQRLIIKH